jgi:hypothetical protein
LGIHILPLDGPEYTFGLLAKANSSALLALKTIGIIFLSVGALFYIAWPHLPTQDAAQYFDFVDTRRILGLENFWNVFSNVFFLYMSLFGFFIFIRNYHAYDTGLWESFLLLNISVFLTCWGSSYFHLNPTPQNLIWDRLPMAVGFAALVSFIFSDRVTDRYTRILLPVLSAISIGAVLMVDFGPRDLRPYIVVQFGSILACLFIMLMYRWGRLSTKLILTSFAFYLVAKLCEHFDAVVFDYLFLSGHTLKHLLAGVAILLVNIAASRVHLKIKREGNI